MATKVHDGWSALTANASSQNPFQYPRDLDGLQATLAGLSQAAFYAAGALLVAVGGGAGYLAGSQAPGTDSMMLYSAHHGTLTMHVCGTYGYYYYCVVYTHTIPSFNTLKTSVNPRIIASAAGALAGAAGAAYATLQLKTMREGAAAVQLYNLIVSKGDPRLLTRDDVAALEAQVGVALGTALADEVKPIYGAFVEAIIPVGDEPLTYVVSFFFLLFSLSTCVSSAHHMLVYMLCCLHVFIHALHTCIIKTQQWRGSSVHRRLQGRPRPRRHRRRRRAHRRRPPHPALPL